MVTVDSWIEALEGDKYKQATQVLRRNDLQNNSSSFCCLGVLADLAGGEWEEGRTPGVRLPDGEVLIATGEPITLVNDVLLAAGINNPLRKTTCERLIEANDEGASFKTIAAALRKCKENPSISASLTLKEEFNKESHEDSRNEVV